MATYILFYDYVDDYLEKRTPVRPVHFEHAQAAIARGELIVAGAYGEAPQGAALVFTVDDKSVIESFAENDPYNKNGLITGWSIREWTVVVGSDRLSP